MKYDHHQTLAELAGLCQINTTTYVTLERIPGVEKGGDNKVLTIVDWWPHLCFFACRKEESSKGRKRSPHFDKKSESLYSTWEVDIEALVIHTQASTHTPNPANVRQAKSAK